MIPRDGAPHALGPGFPSRRVVRRIEEARRRRGLDLSGLIVLTEAATGYYRTTPVIAALAGAEAVLAVARDTSFGSREDARAQVEDLARAAGVRRTIEVRFEPARDLAGLAEVVTNLGAVRPLDRAFGDRLRAPRASVSLMFGAADARPADIDVAALRAASIPVAGVDEEAIGLFRWTGQRIAWWLTEAGLEIVGARLVVWGGGPPARHVARWLDGAGARVLATSRRPRLADLAGADALLLMDRRARLADDAPLRPDAVARAAPGAAVLEYAGEVDRRACRRAGLFVYPPEAPARGHVARTIGEILYAPVVELHAAGLKVGEVMSRARGDGLGRAACERRALADAPGERVTSAPRRRDAGRRP